MQHVLIEGGSGQISYRVFTDDSLYCSRNLLLKIQYNVFRILSDMKQVDLEPLSKSPMWKYLSTLA